MTSTYICDIQSCISSPNYYLFVWYNYRVGPPPLPPSHSPTQSPASLGDCGRLSFKDGRTKQMIYERQQGKLQGQNVPLLGNFLKINREKVNDEPNQTKQQNTKKA